MNALTNVIFLQDSIIKFNHMFVLTNGVKQYYLLLMVFELISQCNNMIVH